MRAGAYASYSVPLVGWLAPSGGILHRRGLFRVHAGLDSSVDDMTPINSPVQRPRSKQPRGRGGADIPELVVSASGLMEARHRHPVT